MSQKTETHLFDASHNFHHRLNLLGSPSFNAIIIFTVFALPSFYNILAIIPDSMMKRPIYEPSTYRNSDDVVIVVGVKHPKLRSTKRRKGSKKSKRADDYLPVTALNIKRRVLRYAAEDQVRVIPNRRQISLEERNATWITAKEFRRIQKETAEVIENIEANSNHESFSSLSAASNLNPPPITASAEASSNNTEDEPHVLPSNSDDDTKKTDESSNVGCVRGLEQHTKAYIGTKVAVQRLMHETVDKIRFLEAQDGKDYGHVLAQLCQVCSATAITNAQVLGGRDAQEAGHHCG